MQNNEFKFNVLKPVSFFEFSYDDIKIKSNEILKLQNGKTITAKKFIKEVNEIKKKLK